MGGCYVFTILARDKICHPELLPQKMKDECDCPSFRAEHGCHSFPSESFLPSLTSNFFLVYFFSKWNKLLVKDVFVFAHGPMRHHTPECIDNDPQCHERCNVGMIVRR